MFDDTLRTRAKSITDDLITPANGDSRSAYTNTTTFQYDGNGNLTQESGPSGTVNYVFDPPTQRHTETWTGTDYANAETDIGYGYNLLGELSSVTVLKENGAAPAAVTSSTQYDAVGNTSMTTLPNTVYTYDAGGRLTSSFDSATGITTTYGYKPNTNYVQEVKSTDSSSTVLVDDTYSYRDDGLKTGASEYTLNSGGSSDTVTLGWTYDALDRLTSETSSGIADVTALNYTDVYAYDLDSNRVTETIKDGGGTTTDTITSSYNNDDELTDAVDANNGTTHYGYDNNGSQASVTHTPVGGGSADSTTTNQYDLQGQLAGTETTDSSGTTSATYEYDDSGNRIEESNTDTGSTTTTTYYLVDTQNPTGYSQPIEQAATPGSPQITYVWGMALISQTYATGATIPGVGTASSPTTYYILTDAHGSTQLVTDSSGSFAANYNYDAFGNALGFDASTALTTFLYSSMPFDPVSGNYYDHARFYNAGIGEFTQADYAFGGTFIDPMSSLPYVFTGGDPINMMDLNGHQFDLTEILLTTALDSFAIAWGGMLGVNAVRTAAAIYNPVKADTKNDDGKWLMTDVGISLGFGLGGGGAKSVVFHGLSSGDDVAGLEFGFELELPFKFIGKYISQMLHTAVSLPIALANAPSATAGRLILDNTLRTWAKSIGGDLKDNLGFSLSFGLGGGMVFNAPIAGDLGGLSFGIEGSLSSPSLEGFTFGGTVGAMKAASFHDGGWAKDGTYELDAGASLTVVGEAESSAAVACSFFIPFNMPGWTGFI